MSRRIAASALRSAIVTGDRSALSSTTILCRKCGRMASPAASTRAEASARNASSSPTFLLFQAVEIGDDIRAVLNLWQARECHLCALREVLRLIKPNIELVRVPLLALMRGERLRELIVRYCGDVLFHDAVEVGADLVGAAFIEGVALQADLGNLLAVLRVGLCHRRLDRLDFRRGLRGSRRARLRAFLGARRQVSCFLQMVRAGKRGGDDAEI